MNELFPLFTMINEEGEHYDDFADYQDALTMLREYPNDSIKVTLQTREYIIALLPEGER